MKKFSTLIMVLCLVFLTFALTACGEKSSKDDSGSSKVDKSSSKTDDSSSKKKGDSVYKTVADALEKTMNAKSYDADINTMVKTDLMGMVSEDGLSVNVKANALDTDKPEVLSEGQIIYSGYPVDQKNYFDGEWNYMADGYKSRCTLEEFAQQCGGPQYILTELPESLFKDAESKKDGDILKVTLTIDEEIFEELYKEDVTDVVYDVVGPDLSQAVTKDATIEITVADGYIRDYKVSFVCEITAGSDKVTYDATRFVEFFSCDKDVKVEAPENLEEYYELDWG